jgi:hypothetical protein
LISGIWFHPLCLFLIGGYFYLVWDVQFSSYMPCTTNFPFQEHNILKVEANCVSLVMPNYMKSEFLSLGILSAPSIFNFISLFFFFLRQSLALWPQLTWNLLCSSGWPPTCDFPECEVYRLESPRPLNSSFLCDFYPNFLLII